MKIRKERKKREPKSDAQKKTMQPKKIGRIFNPCVRFLQYAILVVGIYYLVIYTAIDIVPAIGNMIGSVVSGEAAENFILLLMNWLMPYLFVIGFLFAGEYWLIKKVVYVICKYADNLIEKYKVSQTKMMEEQMEKSDE